VSVVEPTPLAAPSRRPLNRVVMHWVRRAHLYLGLFLLPWAVLYGVTAFLFNHPGAFSDQATTGFGRTELKGTPLESPPSPAEVAEQVVTALNERAGGTTYTLVDPGRARYTRDFAFATVKTDDGEQVSVLFDALGGGGTVRAQARQAEAKPTEPAPFAVGGRGARGKSPERRPRAQAVRERPAEDGLGLAGPLHERVKAAVPAVLEKTGFPAGEVTVTSVPDLNFRMEGGGQTWSVTYNAMAGTVTGVRADAEPRPTMSVRRFLLRLHLAHGYPSSVGARWFWALLVDAMAAVMLFWGVSGLFMWWQIKATRPLGALTLVFSAAVAVVLTWGMYRALTGG
jgi:hypothetical protein